MVKALDSLSFYNWVSLHSSRSTVLSGETTFFFRCSPRSGWQTSPWTYMWRFFFSLYFTRIFTNRDVRQKRTVRPSTDVYHNKAQGPPASWTDSRCMTSKWHCHLVNWYLYEFRYNYTDVITNVDSKGRIRVSPSTRHYSPSGHQKAHNTRINCTRRKIPSRHARNPTSAINRQITDYGKQPTIQAARARARPLVTSDEIFELHPRKIVNDDVMVVKEGNLRNINARLHVDCILLFDNALRYHA